MKWKLFWHYTLNLSISFVASCVLYFLLFLPFLSPFIFKGKDYLYNENVIEIIKLSIGLAFVSFVFFIPIIFLCAIAMLIVNKRLGMLLAFIYFELYGYIWFVQVPINSAIKYSWQLEKPIFEMHMEYFMHSIPLTILLLLFWLLINSRRSS
ncbi:hypothetical protein V9W64_05905 [Neisseria leonii]|uniref:Lipoprotein n=1 Tax=Neisseria leonii TaxID=2995413 RepID=A0A9X4IF23_9NEIS|nr:hypothetical protein [Neisseria sp. 51.81]MDD9328738.1 hypothetical protein [Neisseria sp. 51.81]